MEDIMSKRNEGFCHICGNYTELTFEHIPPKKTGNQMKVNEISGNVLIEAMADNKRLPWDLKGLKYKQKQKGMGKHTLCKSCNNNTGSWYGEDYVVFSNTMATLLAKEKPQPNLGVAFTVQMKPLNVMKQILSFFCSINKYPVDEQICDFVLDRESQNFNFEDYILTMFLYIGTIEKYIGTFVILHLPDSTNNISGNTTASEICSYPLGFCLYKKTDSMRKIIGADISNFAECSYGKDYIMELTLPVYTSNSMLPNDYRLRKEFKV